MVVGSAVVTIVESDGAVVGSAVVTVVESDGAVVGSAVSRNSS